MVRARRPAASLYPQNDRPALITGAASGLGAAFARRLARRGWRVALVARRAERLAALAEELVRAGAPPPAVLPADLTDPAARADLWARLCAQDFAPALVINNAGAGRFGPFVACDRDQALALVRLNCEAVVDLSHRALAAMESAGGGVLVNVASVLAWGPAPALAVYAASKAFVLSFSEALDAEVRPRGLQVTAVCPGPVATEFAQVAGMGAQRGRRWSLAADDCARRALADAARGRRLSVPGALPKVYHLLTRVLPRRLLTRLNDRSLAWGGAREDDG